MCFGLRRDTSLKIGQIAHLDRNSSNNDPENLAFLCLEHHSEYDSRSYQAKGYTIPEVKRYRSELYSAIKIEWNKPPSFAQTPSSPYNSIAGHYVREDSNELSEFDIQQLPDGALQVQGFALWGTQTMSPHTGDVYFSSPVQGNRLYFCDRLDNKWYNLELRFTSDGLEVDEQILPGYFGMNVSFRGKYRKV